ncbi:aromatic ring-hydroxylating dioxygenase subunit alpha [Actinomadura craniellae]|uniref:Aromatic ring-hydroxylating dioxygenase subunit alpha n=2 Tax=Actinomadura craniellae TaxID=2231787 RepID=A0A365H3H6_9ACTN|nr:aromatic ring-hydroxylating dioxygenase subunit alpha [Actinomadura craniellae]
MTAETSALLAELGRYREPGAPALSLPPRAFVSAELWELERARVFGRSWVLVAHADELAAPGSRVALSVAGEPVEVVRGDDGALRGTPPGRRRPAPRVEQWNGLVFVNLDAGAEPLAPHLARVGAELAGHRLDEMVQVGGWLEEWRCNWKLAVQNAHENYHAMGLHPNTVALLTPPGADMAVRADSRWVTRLLSPFREPMEPVVLALDDEYKANMYNCCVFPCGSVAAFGDSVIWISLIPLTADRTQVRGGALLPAAMVEGADRAALRAESEEGAAVVNDEDRAGMEAVQRCAGARFAGRGHLSPKEPGVLAFYRSLAVAMLGE